MRSCSPTARRTAEQGDARLPAPPMLMFDRITHIDSTGGNFSRGVITAELDLNPDLWFYQCISSAIRSCPAAWGSTLCGRWSGSSCPGRDRPAADVRLAGNQVHRPGDSGQEAPRIPGRHQAAHALAAAIRTGHRDRQGGWRGHLCRRKPACWVDPGIGRHQIAVISVRDSCNVSIRQLRNVR